MQIQYADDSGKWMLHQFVYNNIYLIDYVLECYIWSNGKNFDNITNKSKFS